MAAAQLDPAVVVAATRRCLALGAGRGRPCETPRAGRAPANLQARVALILPAEACSYFRVPAPPGLKREEWPLLLEDRLLQAVDEVTCACLAREPGHLRLLVVARQQLEDWRGQCAEWGLQVARCWAELQLLPPPSRDMPGNGSAHPACICTKGWPKTGRSTG